MNYHLTLVRGEDAAYLLEDWPPGGVEIADDVVGLFEGTKRARELSELLELHRAARVAFDQTALLKVGLARSWSWRRAGWDGQGPIARRLEAEISELLAAGFPADKEQQAKLLKLIQAASRRLGPLSYVDGLYKRPSGLEDRIVVSASGAVRYDRTPHPMPFLQEVLSVIRKDA